MKRIHLFLCCVLLCTIVHAQKQALSFGYIPRTRIALNLSSFLDIKPFAELALDQKTSERTSWEAGLGVYMPWTLYSDTPFQFRQSGFRLRVFLKNHDRQGRPRDNNNSYWGPEAMFKYQSLEATGWYNRYHDSYQEYRSCIRRQSMLCLGLRAGEQFFFGRKKTIFIDYNAGLGCQLTFVRIPDLPEDALFINDNIGDSSGLLGLRTAGTYCYPYVTMGIRLGYVYRH